MVKGSYTHWLRSYMTHMQARLDHLHHAIGSQMNARNKTLLRENGRDPWNVKTSNLGDHSPLDGIYDDLLGSLRSTARSQISSLIRQKTNSSSGQNMSDLASAIARSMTRDM